MKTIKNYNSSLAATRQRLGLTQEQMALQLGVSKSTVKLVETCRRTLSSEKLITLASLEIQLAAIQQPNPTYLPICVKQKYDLSDIRFDLDIKFKESRCKHKALQLEKKLASMQEAYTSILTCLHNIDAMAARGMNAADNTGALILSARQNLLNRLSRCNPQLQAQAKAKIALLHAEASLIKSIQPRYVHTNEKPILSPLKQTNMNYTVALISSRADCQALIDMANEDKASLDYRKTGLERQRQNASSTSVSIDADLASVTAEVTALQTVVAGLPNGETKDDTAVRLKKAEYKKFLLEERKANYGSMALISKEYDIACIEQSIVETDAYILALTNRMNELPTV